MSELETSDTFDDRERPMDVIGQARGAMDEAKAAYQNRKDNFETFQAAYFQLVPQEGVKVPEGVKQLLSVVLKKYGPMAAKYFGGPAAGAAFLAMASNEGAFSGGLKGIISNLLSVFGAG